MLANTSVIYNVYLFQAPTNLLYNYYYLKRSFVKCSRNPFLFTGAKVAQYASVNLHEKIIGHPAYGKPFPLTFKSANLIYR